MSAGAGPAPPQYASLGEEARDVLWKVVMRLKRMGKAWLLRAMRTVADKVTDALSQHVSVDALQRLQQSRSRLEAQQEAQAKRRKQQVAAAREKSPAAPEEAEPPSNPPSDTASAQPQVPATEAPPVHPPATAVPVPVQPSPPAAPAAVALVPPATAAAAATPTTETPAAPIPAFGSHWGLSGSTSTAPAAVTTPAAVAEAPTAPQPRQAPLDMRINFLVKTIGKRLIPIESMLPTDTVRRLKFRFEELENVAPKKQDLYHKNILMRDEKMLKDYGVTEGSIINMIYVGDD